MKSLHAVPGEAHFNELVSVGCHVLYMFLVSAVKVLVLSDGGGLLWVDEKERKVKEGVFTATKEQKLRKAGQGPLRASCPVMTRDCESSESMVMVVGWVDERRTLGQASKARRVRVTTSWWQLIKHHAGFSARDKASLPSFCKPSPP